MELNELDTLLTQLARFGTDHQDVEAKRARRALPESTWTTLSAFANTGGGVLLLGVDEKEGFAVTGVEAPAQIISDLQALASHMEPPLRLSIHPVEHPKGIVVAARVPPVPRVERPCHLRTRGPHGGSFVRIGDGDYALTDAEVSELLAGRRGGDLSARPAPDGARLEAGHVAAFCDAVRDASARDRDKDDSEILRQAAAVMDGGPTLAGALAMGENVQALSPAARIAYRRLPDDSAPAGARFSGAQIEGTVGEILDGTLAAIRNDLKIYQVEEGGNLVDEADVPLEALREIVSNALIHRSLTPSAEAHPVIVEVSTQAVRVISPGGLHSAVDPDRIGLRAFPSVRNLTLVRICEKLRSPSGHRIVESQGSGIIAADRAAYRRGTAPPLFADHPDYLEVLLLRGRLPAARATDLLREAGLEPQPRSVRLIGWALRYDEVHGGLDPLQRRAGLLDAHLAARLCTPLPIEDASAELAILEGAGLLQRTGRVPRSTWAIRREAAPAHREPQRIAEEAKLRVQDVLAAIVAAGGEASRDQIGDHLGLRSTRSAMAWINRAADAGLVVPTTESPFDRRRKYRLSARGAHAAGGKQAG